MSEETSLQPSTEDLLPDEVIPNKKRKCSPGRLAIAKRYYYRHRAEVLERVANYSKKRHKRKSSGEDELVKKNSAEDWYESRSYENNPHSQKDIRLKHEPLSLQNYDDYRRPIKQKIVDIVDLLGGLHPIEWLGNRSSHVATHGEVIHTYKPE
jgi:hypothetical protein